MTSAVSFPTERYSKVAVILHWLIALLILMNIALGLSADSMPQTWTRPMIDVHKSIGLTVLGLVIVRLLWRLSHEPPALPARLPLWERLSAHVGHWALYIMMFVMPVTGWIHDSAWSAAASHPFVLFGFIPWFRLGFIMTLDPDTKEHVHKLFGTLHYQASFVLYALLAVHVLAVIKHHAFEKYPVLKRMTLS